MSDRPDMLAELLDSLEALIEARLAALPPDPPPFDPHVFTGKTVKPTSRVQKPCSETEADADV